MAEINRPESADEEGSPDAPYQGGHSELRGPEGAVSRRDLPRELQEEDSKRRYAKLRECGIHFLDCRTSGGVERARLGTCFMVGGDGEAFLRVKPVFEDHEVIGDLCTAAMVGSTGS